MSNAATDRPAPASPDLLSQTRPAEKAQPTMTPGAWTSQLTLKPVTCISSDYHDHENITDKLTHYLGCVELWDRERFYNTLTDEAQHQIRLELRRIAFIRRVIENSQVDGEAAQRLVASLKDWRADSRDAVAEVGRWSAMEKPYRKKAHHDPNSDRPFKDGKPEEYIPDKDFNAYYMQFDSSAGVTNTTRRPNGDFLFKAKFPNQKISVNTLLHDPDFNPLKRQTKKSGDESKCIRYFHLPSNNMKWVQEAIARYYDEPNPQYDTAYRKAESRTCANMLLRRDFWLGQEQGRGSHIIHTRHMRPLCEPVSSDPEKTESKPRNIVMFMPYLHWELDQQRGHFSALIDRRSTLHQENILKEELRRYDERRDQRQGLYKVRPPPSVRVTTERVTSRRDTNETNNSIQRPPNDPPEAVTRRVEREPGHRFRHILPQWPYRDAKGHLITKNKLGQLLWDASKLFAAINNYRDRKLIDNYLLADPPLHPRRTLDQSYYWTLRNTKARDRDQVVYRGTSARAGEHHQHLVEEDEPKKDQAAQPVTWRGWTSMQETAWDAVLGTVLEQPQLPTVEPVAPCSHPKISAHVECLTCREVVRKIPRLLMVDQLWMWILDDDTIITCFPKRWGVDRQDHSGVHKAIRQRMGRARHNHIRSAYDLGLVIIDECSSLFFDRTKTDERQPQVMEIFSEAIGNMAQKQTISSNHLWHWANELAKASNKKSSLVDLSELHIALLNITPEGKLQRETKDIIEELDIMIHIARKQKELLKRFKKHAEGLLDPTGTYKAGETWDIMLAQGRAPVGHNEGYEKWKWFRANADEVIQEADDHLDELEGLRKSADDVCRNLDSLLSLKQQQASVVQAWQSIRHGEEAVKQGRSIMIFTVVTIIFLPLAFMSGVLQLYNDVVENHGLPFQNFILYMFTISIGVIIVIVIIAFSTFVRALAWSLAHISFNWLLVKTGLYGFWLQIADKMQSDNMVMWAEREVNEMKERVKRERRRHLAQKYELETKRFLEESMAEGRNTHSTRT